MEESKRKLQQTDQSLCTPISSSDQSLDSPTIKSEVILRRPSKVEQTRRNSRTDRKNFGRYFTADGTGTTSNHSTDEAAMLSSSSSSTITKRMSWNNERPTEKGDSLLITNSFRSVHSSSGVSSTGSFLFSTDEESSLSTTTPSTSSILPTTNENENPNSENERDKSSWSNTKLFFQQLLKKRFRRSPRHSVEHLFPVWNVVLHNRWTLVTFVYLHRLGIPWRTIARWTDVLAMTVIMIIIFLLNQVPLAKNNKWRIHRQILQRNQFIKRIHSSLDDWSIFAVIFYSTQHSMPRKKVSSHSSLSFCSFVLFF